MQAYLHKNTWAATRNIYQAHGAGGFYRGFLSTMIRDVPEIAIQFWAYETLRKVSRVNGVVFTVHGF